MLLTRHKETHGELSLREQLLRKVEAQSAETVRQKEQHINQLMTQLQVNDNRHAGECDKYRLEIGNLEDKRKELEERLVASEMRKDTALRAEKDCLVADFNNLRVDAESRVEMDRQKAAANKVSFNHYTNNV